MITIAYILAALATVSGVVVGTGRAAMNWHGRRRYGPGPPVYDLAGRRVTWARRTGMPDEK